MIRSEILNEIAPILRDQLVVCNIGIPSQELHAIDDQPTNFYMLGTMGLASSIGLGLALSQPKPVIVMDGDGSILTNLGTLLAESVWGGTQANGECSLAYVRVCCNNTELSAPNAIHVSTQGFYVELKTIII